MDSKNKIICIVGPTATGKSDYAVALALSLKKNGKNAEIISADSRQVYKGLDIGSGKITKKEMKGVIHHMLDVVNPRSVFSVEQFTKKASAIIARLHKKNIIPIICGGTGFYIDSLVYDTALPNVPPNKTFRKQLGQKTIEALGQELLLKDPERAETIDMHNKVRLIRALEIVETLGKVPLHTKKEIYTTQWIGLDLPDETLKTKIQTRLQKRIKQGMIKEVTQLHENGVSWKRLEDLGLEYRYIALYLQNKLTKNQMIEMLETKIWQYAKRQRTWFKKNKNIEWISPQK